MSVLRRAYVEVEPDVTDFDAKLREKFNRTDPGGKAGKQLGGQLNRALKRLDLDPIDVKANPSKALAALGETERKLLALSRQASTVEIRVQAERGLREIAQFRRTLGNVGEEAAPEAAAGFAARLGGRLGPMLASLPVSPPLLAALGAAGAAGAPVFVSALASGLSAGAGLGVIGIGLRAIANNPVVKLRATELGKNFSENLQREAKEAFGGPVLQALDRLDAAGRRVTFQLGEAFDALAPHIDPFTQKVIGAGEAVTGSLTSAAKQSGPALAGMGDAITLLGDGAAYFIGTVSDGGPEAADNLRLIAGVTADLAKHSASLLNVTNDLANNSWITGPLLPLLRKHYAEAAAEAQRLKEQQAKIPPELTLTAEAARGQRDALTGLSKEIKAQTDPAFALLTAQQNLKKAHEDAATAVKKHGRNSVEAREATRTLALAALDLQGKTGALGTSFTGKLTPAMIASYRAAGLTERQIADVEREFIEAKRAGDKFDGAFKANVSSTGVPHVMSQLDKLLIRQQSLSKGISISAATSAFRKNAGYADGGWTGPGGKYQPAGVVHADEFVIRKESRQKLERSNPGLLSELNATGQVPGYAKGGQVWPYPTTAAMTRVPSLREALAVVAPAFSRDWPSSPAAQRGDSGVWRRVLQLIKSGPNQGSFGNAYRPGDPKWHGSGRAVDWMGYNMDALASYLARQRPLELIHRTRKRDYAYTRGRNLGSFNNSLMEAHRNHIHIAMDQGGYLMPGWNPPIWNGTGRAEPVTPAREMDEVIGLLRQMVKREPKPLIGEVTVKERTDVDMLVNKMAFALGGL